MTKDEYVELFHKVQLNLVAFKPLFHCDDEVLKLVNHAIEAEREACAKLLDDATGTNSIVSCASAAKAIRARSED
jgi:hypothetical protein